MRVLHIKGIRLEKNPYGPAGSEANAVTGFELDFDHWGTICPLG